MINTNSPEWRAIISAWPDDPMMAYGRSLRSATRPLSVPIGSADLPLPAGMTKADLLPRTGTVRVETVNIRLEADKKC